MKNRVVVWMLMLWGLYSCELPIADETDRMYSDTLRVGTYNVRIASGTDDVHQSWSFRRNYVALQVYTHAFDVLGIQELSDSYQEQDLKRLLPNFDHFSKGNGNAAGTAGQRIAVLYDKRRFEPLDSGFFFLSDLPTEPVLAWDAQCVHLCVWLKLHDRHTSKDFYFINTHLSWCGKDARKQSVQLILNRIRQFPQNLPLVLGSDLNAPPTETETYTPLATCLSDSRLVSETDPTGYEGTFNNWENTPWNFTESRRIDYLFVRHVRVLSYQVLSEQFVEDCWPSDHFPILLSIIL